LLMKSYFKEIDSWSKEIATVIMETVTVEGAQFAERLGMERVKVKENTTVWKISYDQLKSCFILK